MTIYPAIDLKGGRCVRLQQGDPDRETVFGDDAAAMARHWVEQGAEWLHLVDLDGAFSGHPQNADAIRAMTAAVSVPTQLGGGLRAIEQVEAAVNAGVRRPILGTAAVETPDLVRVACERFPGRIAIGIDARDGLVATRGWKTVTEMRAVEFAQQVEALGASAIIYTDIGRDGMLEGANVEATRRLAEAVSIPVIGSGGVASLEDIEAFASVSDAGIEGVISGTALYKGHFTLAEAIAVAKRATPSGLPPSASDE